MLLPGRVLTIVHPNVAYYTIPLEVITTYNKRAAGPCSAGYLINDDQLSLLICK